MDIDARIHEAETALEAQVTRVDRLKRDLEHEEKKLDGMKAQLDALRVHKFTQPHPISTVPPEILSQILRKTIEDARQNVTLMLVCRNWWRIIEADPLMWSKIVARYPEKYWNIEAWIETHRPLVQRWIVRGGATLLDISLDFAHLLPTRQGIRQRLEDAFSRTIAEMTSADPLVDFIDLRRWSDDLTYEGFIDEAILTELSSASGVLGLLEDLIGHDGEIMERWQSFSLVFPQSNVDFLNQLWAAFRYPTPHLRTLILSNHEDPFLNWWANPPTEDQIHLWSILPKLPSLFELNISVAINWDVISPQHTTIGNLTYSVIDGSTFHSRISSFQNLKRLEVSFLFRTRYLASFVGNTTARLPLLEELVISNYDGDVKNMRLLLPKLVRLILRYPSDLALASFPSVSPKHAIFETRILVEVSKAQRRAWLNRFINHFHQTEEISFLRGVKKEVLDALKYLLRAPADNGVGTIKRVSFFNTLEEMGQKETWTMKELQNARKE